MIETVAAGRLPHERNQSVERRDFSPAKASRIVMNLSPGILAIYEMVKRTSTDVLVTAT